MNQAMAQVLAEAAESPYGLELISPKPLSLYLTMVHAIASLPGCGLEARRVGDRAVWLLHKKALAA